MLAAAGGLCGFGLEYVGIKLFFNLPPDMGAPYWVHFTMDRVVFDYVALLSAAVRSTPSRRTPSRTACGRLACGSPSVPTHAASGGRSPAR